VFLDPSITWITHNYRLIHSYKCKKRKISVTRSWILHVIMYRARCFGGFRFANGCFRLIVLTVNDRPITMGVVAARAHELMGLIEQPLSLRFTPSYTTVSCVVMHVGKSREILIAVRCHFESEIEGGHLDPSRRDDTGSLRDCGTILCPSPRWPFRLAFYARRRGNSRTRFYCRHSRKKLPGNMFLF